jgi:cytochrome b
MNSSLPTRRVVDAPTRAFHWTLACCFLGAYISAESERWRLVHVTLGYAMAGLLVFRLLYGMFGPRQSAIGNMWRQCLGLKAWCTQALHSLRTAGQVPAARQGLHLLMGALILCTLVVIVPLTFFGYGAYNDWDKVFPGDWIAETHEFFGNALLALIGLHIGLVVLISLMQKKNMALPMITGRQAGKGPDLVKNNRLWLALSLVGCVATWFVWQWMLAGG